MGGVVPFAPDAEEAGLNASDDIFVSLEDRFELFEVSFPLGRRSVLVGFGGRGGIGKAQDHLTAVIAEELHIVFDGFEGIGRDILVGEVIEVIEAQEEGTALEFHFFEIVRLVGHIRCLRVGYFPLHFVIEPAFGVGEVSGVIGGIGDRGCAQSKGTEQEGDGKEVFHI